MRGLQMEYILKGIYLGLLLYVAAHTADWTQVGTVAACTVGGLGVCLALAAVGKLQQGVKVGGQWLAFFLFLLLESPGLVYTGVLAGTAAGALLAIPPPEGSATNWQLLSFAGGGAGLGILFAMLREVQQPQLRFGLILLLAAALVTGMLVAFGQFDALLGMQLKQIDLTALNTTIFAVQLLIGVPVFYLLAFSGRAEESEVEIGAVCAALGLALWLLVHGTPDMKPFQSLTFLLPLVLYFVYTLRILPGLRVFKHVLRGLSYLRMNKYGSALFSLRRALQLDPQNALALKALWDLHRSVDVDQLRTDPKLLAMLDYDLCLERAGALLGSKPSPAQLDEANRLLDLVLGQKPAMRPRVQYWRVVALLHAREYDRAAAELEHVLDPAHPGLDAAQRNAILLQAWQLALLLHEEMRRRVGGPQLALPGRRMEAIAAVERHLADNPNDQGIWELKRLLYQDVTEAEYDAAAGAPDVAVRQFDHGYAQQLGLALINDPARWQRGGEYLRLAARGMPATGPTIFKQIAEAHQRNGNVEGARQNYELVKRTGRLIGPKNLPDEERHAYFATVKLLADDAHARGDVDAAIENYTLMTESERSGLETLRTLADLHEKRGDPLMALRVTEQALIYNGRDRDLLERKDRYYYSVMPDDLQARVEAVRLCFDVAYCLRKAKSLLDTRDADLELIAWAQHLATVVRVVQPESVTARVILARAHLRLGERDEAVRLLESLRDPRPAQFVSGEDEESWYLASRLLGDLYLYELNRPDLAVACFTDFSKSSKSGADTMFKLGQAHEQLGDVPRARRYYEKVMAYDNHPRAPDAREALSRLQSARAPGQ
jgi:tetratricopeptide (TPR) repeat protein